MLVDKVTEQVAEIDYTFYDNLSQSSISVIKDAYNATLKTSDTDPEADAPKFYYVQIGAFSKENTADSFRAEALLEGYLSADIFVESTADVHRVMIGPSLKSMRQNSQSIGQVVRSFQGCCWLDRINVAPEMTASTTPNPDG